MGCSQVNALHLWLYGYQGNAMVWTRSRETRPHITFSMRAIINTGNSWEMFIFRDNRQQIMSCKPTEKNRTTNDIVIIIIAHLDPLFGQQFCILLGIEFEKFTKKNFFAIGSSFQSLNWYRLRKHEVSTRLFTITNKLGKLHAKTRRNRSFWNNAN